MWGRSKGTRLLSWSNVKQLGGASSVFLVLTPQRPFEKTLMEWCGAVKGARGENADDLAVKTMVMLSCGLWKKWRRCGTLVMVCTAVTVWYCGARVCRAPWVHCHPRRLAAQRGSWTQAGGFPVREGQQ